MWRFKVKIKFIRKNNWLIKERKLTMLKIIKVKLKIISNRNKKIKSWFR